MNDLDLCSGVGGFSLGLGWAGFNTVAFCEKDKKCQQVLKKHWPETPIYPDIYKLTYEKLKANGIKTIDVICAGIPCQPYSFAGKRKGKKDDRYLWPPTRRLIKEIRPTWVIIENVAGIVSLALDEILVDLEDIGYSARPLNIPACAVNAPHQRKRIWILAHTDNSTRSAQQKRKREKCSEKLDGCSKNWMVAGDDLADTESNGLEKEWRVGRKKERKPRPTSSGWWQTEPDVGRVVDGFPGRVDRLKQLGNAVVPQIPYLIGKAIMEIEHDPQTQSTKEVDTGEIPF